MNFTFPLLGVIALGVVTLLASEGITLSVNKSEEYKLRSDILKHKEPMVRPVQNYSEAVNVSFYMDVLNLTDLDNKRQMLATNVWILQRWQNPFLEWKKEDYRVAINRFGKLVTLNCSRTGSQLIALENVVGDPWQTLRVVAAWRSARFLSMSRSVLLLLLRRVMEVICWKFIPYAL